MFKHLYFLSCLVLRAIWFERFQMYGGRYEQNRITKLNTTVADRNKTESQNRNQSHKNPKQNRKIRNRITKLKTESQNPKQN